MAAYLARTEHRRHELEEDAVEDGIRASWMTGRREARARQFELVKELLTAPALGTS